MLKLLMVVLAAIGMVVSVWQGEVDRGILLLVVMWLGYISHQLE